MHLGERLTEALARRNANSNRIFALGCGGELAGIPRHHSAAMRVSEHLDELADHLIGHFVDQARKAGASWTEIGQSMGVTKQAAQKRFVPKATEWPEEPDEGGWHAALTDAFRAHPFSRFTPRAKGSIKAAAEEARERRHELRRRRERRAAMPA